VAAGFETALRSNFSHSNQMCDCNYIHQLANDLLIKTVGNCQPNVAEKLTLSIWNGGPTKWDGLFLSSFRQKRREWPSHCQTRRFYRNSHAVCTLQVHLPPPPLPTFLLTLLEVTSWSWKHHDKYINYGS